MRRLIGMLAIMVAAGCASNVSAHVPDASSNSGSASTRSVGPLPQTPNPLRGASFYANPDSPALAQLHTWRAQNDTADADTIQALASQPTAIWLAGQANPGQVARRVSTAAAAAGQWPVFTLYDIPARDCGQYSSGGAAGRDAYLAWVGNFASGLADRRAVVIIEPDAIAHALSGCDAGGSADDRYRMLSAAVDIVKHQSGVLAYLDAGNSDWVKDTDRLAQVLRTSGIDHADGFSLNVANFQSTDASVTYGRRISASLGGQHFVIDTSRNGAAPLEGTGVDAWCNPPNRKLGQFPTADTHIPDVDAFLWIKQPGDSDGVCHGGRPAGQWSPQLALDLARR